MTLDIVILGLSITSAWGNGHATTYRALIKALARRGHRVTFLERATPWYRAHRDLKHADYCQIETYEDLTDLAQRFGSLVTRADLVILGSYVPDGIALGEWITAKANGITAFYDIDTPVTLSNLERGESDYLSASLIPRFDLFLSFTGGPVLDLIEERYGSPRARVLYCSADPDQHRPIEVEAQWQLGYLGTYSPDRQPVLDSLLVVPARRLPETSFVLAGAQFPSAIDWPPNIQRFEHIAPADHAAFYCAQHFTLNATRADMAARGYSPSVRLFEAAACGIPVISDRWPGLDTLFRPGEEILIANDAEDVIRLLRTVSEERRRAIGKAARSRFLRDHTPDQRAKALESYYREAANASSESATAVVA
jgi:spore maturation protein CgeB